MLKTIQRLSLLIVFLMMATFFMAESSSAKTVYVGSLKGVAVSEEELLAVEELIRSKVSDELHYQIAESVNKVDYSISGRLVKLGESYTLTLVKSKGDQEQYRSSLKAAMISEMDVVVARLVRAIDREESSSENMTVKDLTYEEQNNQRRHRAVLQQWVFGLGPATAHSLNLQKQSILWNVGYSYEVDYNWDMHLDMDWLTPTGGGEKDASYFAFNFGLNHYLSSANASPYFDAHLGYAWAAASTGENTNSIIPTSNDTASGWLLGGGVGYRFFRTATTNFSVLLRGSYVFASTKESSEHPMVGSLMIVGYFQ